MKHTRSRKNYLSIRAKLMERGLTLSSLADRMGVPKSTIYAAIKGERTGSESVRLAHKINDLAYGK